MSQLESSSHPKRWHKPQDDHTIAWLRPKYFLSDREHPWSTLMVYTLSLIPTNASNTSQNFETTLKVHKERFNVHA